MHIPWTEIELKIYNVISCKGFETAESVGLSFGQCALAKLGFVLIFFINALVRKWGGEEAGMDYSFFGGLVGGFVSYFFVISFLGNFKIAFIIGIVGLLIGGYLGGSIFGGGEGYD